MWQPWRKSPLVKAQNQKDIGLPCAGCSGPAISSSNHQSTTCSPLGRMHLFFFFSQCTYSEAFFRADLINQLLSVKTCLLGEAPLASLSRVAPIVCQKSTPSLQGGLVPSRDGRTTCCHFRPCVRTLPQLHSSNPSPCPF